MSTHYKRKYEGLDEFNIDPYMITDISYYEEELRKQTENNFHSIIQKIKTARKLKTHEQELIQKILKKIRHRDASRRMRLEKKNYTIKLKEKIASLEKENKRLREQISLINKFSQSQDEKQFNPSEFENCTMSGDLPLQFEYINYNLDESFNIYTFDFGTI